MMKHYAFADYVVDFNTKFNIDSPEATRIFQDAADFVA
jgi:glucosamine-6-phosphate deaminase